MNRNGWHDEWQVTGRPGPDVDPVAQVFDSRQATAPGRLAEVGARALMARALAGPPWMDGPHLRHRRVYVGPWEDVPAEPWRGPTRPGVRAIRRRTEGASR